MPTVKLFEPLKLRSLTLKNRIGVSPMCQYSCTDGVVGDWHLVHLGSRAVGGAGLVMAEASAVSAEGRISPGDAGIWNDHQASAWSKITRFISEQGSVPAIQLAHAGWKASTCAPWLGDDAVSPQAGGWQPLSVGSLPFKDNYARPRQASTADLDKLVLDWGQAATRAVQAGFKLVEIHAAHGYLLNSFLSPLSNKRTDQYGDTFENRTRLLLRVVDQVRTRLPEATPLAVRLSCVDWVDGGWSIEDSIALTRKLNEHGVDLIDCSSGGVSPSAKIATGAGYQTEFAAKIKKTVGIHTATVGMITSAQQAETIIRTDQADLVFLGREMLRDPYFPAHAARALGHDLEELTPKQYVRAW